MSVPNRAREFWGCVARRPASKTLDEFYIACESGYDGNRLIAVPNFSKNSQILSRLAAFEYA